jgi:hypothetical protein
LQVEGSKIAITHDDDWHALLEEVRMIYWRGMGCCVDTPIQSDCEIPEDAEFIRRLSVEKIRQDGGEFKFKF